MELILIIVLFLSSLLAALFGIGGGSLYTPIQIWLGVPFKEASSLSLFLILITSFSSTIVYRKAHKVDWKLAMALEIPTAAGAFLGGFFSHLFSNTFLSFFLIVILILSGIFMILSAKTKGTYSFKLKEIKNKKWFWKRKWKENGKELFYYVDIRIAVPIMFSVGIIISILGISGGVFKVPIMIGFFKIPLPIAIGSSALMVGISAASGFLGHATIGNVNWHNILILFIPVFIGARLGSHLSFHTKAEKIKEYYGYFLLGVAFITFLKIL